MLWGWGGVGITTAPAHSQCIRKVHPLSRKPHPFLSPQIHLPALPILWDTLPEVRLDYYHFLNMVYLVMLPGLWKGCFLCVEMLFSLYCSRETPIHPSKPILEIPCFGHFPCNIVLFLTLGRKKHPGLQHLLWRKSLKCYFHSFLPLSLMLPQHFIWSIIWNTNRTLAGIRQLPPPAASITIINT